MVSSSMTSLSSTLKETILSLIIVRVKFVAACLSVCYVSALCVSDLKGGIIMGRKENEIAWLCNNLTRFLRETQEGRKDKSNNPYLKCTHVRRVLLPQSNMKEKVLDHLKGLLFRHLSILMGERREEE
jgi:hypothetical protein